MTNRLAPLGGVRRLIYQITSARFVEVIGCRNHSCMQPWHARLAGYLGWHQTGDRTVTVCQGDLATGLDHTKQIAQALLSLLYVNGL
jgi:hypothetical protein